MRVLVTGHRGYIGSVLTCMLRHAHFDVVGLDSELYTGCDFGRSDEIVPSFGADFRDIDFVDLLSFDAVIHLAGVPDGSDFGFHEAARDINGDAVRRFAEKCKQAQVSRLMLASSWEVYGRPCFPEVHEATPPLPYDDAGRAMLRTEQQVLSLAGDGFSPVVMRLGSVYGVSPRLRLDSPVNDLVASAVATGLVQLTSTGQERLPLIHVEDAARACIALLKARTECVDAQVFNVVRDGEDHRLIDLADDIVGRVPFCRRELRDECVSHRRFRVRGVKLQTVCPELARGWSLQEGITQLIRAMEINGMTPGEWRSTRYRRALRLEWQMMQGSLDATLRTRDVQEVRREEPIAHTRIAAHAG